MPVLVIKITLPTNCANAMLLHQAPMDLLSMFVRHTTQTILKSYLSQILPFPPPEIAYPCQTPKARDSKTGPLSHSNNPPNIT